VRFLFELFRRRDDLLMWEIRDIRHRVVDRVMARTRGDALLHTQHHEAAYAELAKAVTP
jgi:hypothetical protein